MSNNTNTTSVGPKPIIFRGEHPDTRTDREWVRYMISKYPELGWGPKSKQSIKVKK